MAQLCLLSGQTHLGLQLAEQVLALQSKQGDRLGAAVVRLTLGAYATFWSGDYNSAAEHFTRAQGVCKEVRAAGHLVTGSIISRSYLALLALLADDLEQAHALAEAAGLAALKNTPYALSFAEGIAALLAVATGNSAQALEKATAAMNASSQPGPIEISQLARAAAAWEMGNREQATNIATQQWMVSMTLLSQPTRSLLLFYLPILASQAAAAGQPLRAVELLALGRAQPGCPHGWWNRLPSLQALEHHLQATLAPESYAAAQAHGQQLDFATTATALTRELNTWPALTQTANH